MLFWFANASAASAAARSCTNRVPSAYEGRPRRATRWRAVVPAKEPLVGADLAGPVVAFHLGRQPLGVGGAAGDRGLLVAA